MWITCVKTMVGCMCVLFHNTALREDASQINVILLQKLLAAKLRAVCTVYKQSLYVLLSCWLKMLLKNHCKNTGYYSIFQLWIVLLLNKYQYNCNNTISSVSVAITHKIKLGFGERLQEWLSQKTSSAYIIFPVM